MKFKMCIRDRSCSGSLCQNLKQINVPAVDALERYPGNHYYPRTVSSLSRQFSDGRCMAEALGGSGWGLSPADLDVYKRQMPSPV